MPLFGAGGQCVPGACAGPGALSDRGAEAGGGGSYTAQKGLGNTARKQIRRGGGCSGNVKPLQVKSLCAGGEMRTGAPWGSVQTQHSSAEPSRGRKEAGMKEPLWFLPAPGDVGDVERVRKIPPGPPRQLWSLFWEGLRQRAWKSLLSEPNCQASLAGALQIAGAINTEKAKG